MEVQVNHKTQHTEEGVTLFELLQSLGFEEPRGIAVAINNEIIPKMQWNGHALKPSDNITIIRATQGG